MAWVYILENEKHNYYIGSTTDLISRLKHHQKGYTPSTRRLKANKLVLSQEYRTLKEARFVERKLKNFKRKDFIEKIVQEGYIKTKQGL